MKTADPKQKNIIDYDVIFVGHLGAVVCNIILNCQEITNHYLVINQCKNINELSLLPVQSPLVKVNQDSFQKCDWDHGKILRLAPQENLVIMESKTWYRYKYLVYTARTEDWSDFGMIENLHEALLTKYSFVFSNILKNQPNLSEAKIIFERFEGGKNVERRRLSLASLEKSKAKSEVNESMNEDTQRIMCEEASINILFYLPDSPHSGYDNINILYKFHEFFHYYTKLLQKIHNKQKSKDGQNSGEEQLLLNFVVLLEGDSIIPHCQMIDACIKQKMEETGIKIRRKHKIEKIDYLRRKITVTTGQELDEEGRAVSLQIKNKSVFDFDYLYVAIKQKPPSLLTNAGIDPYQNCCQTLANSRFPNIFVLGADIFPTTYSFQAVNYQAHIVACNIAKLMKEGKNTEGLKLYCGFSQFYLWVDQSSYIKFRHSYDDLRRDQKNCKLKSKRKTMKTRERGIVKQTSGCWMCFWESTRCKMVLKWEVNYYYNFKSYGAPFYFFVPENPQIGSVSS